MIVLRSHEFLLPNGVSVISLLNRRKREDGYLHLLKILTHFHGRYDTLYTPWS